MDDALDAVVMAFLVEFCQKTTRARQANRANGNLGRVREEITYLI